MYGGGGIDPGLKGIPTYLAVLAALAGLAIAGGLPLLVLFYPVGSGAWTFAWSWELIVVLASVMLVGFLIWVLTRTKWIADVRYRIGAWTIIGVTGVVCMGTLITIWRLTPPAKQVTGAKVAQPASKGGQASPKNVQKGGQTAGSATAKSGGSSGGSQQTPQTGQTAAVQTQSAAPKMPPQKPKEELHPGEKLVNEKCLSCHRYKGYGFGVTDDLDKAASTHTMSWFIQLLRDPINVGMKRMPKPNLTDAEIYDIARFLAGRGGAPGQEKEWFGNQALQMSDVQLIETGKNTYARFNCESCHKIGDRGGKNGPELTHIGQQRDQAWLEAFFKDYFVQKPAMPFLPLSQDDIRALAAYLASLK